MKLSERLRRTKAFRKDELRQQTTIGDPLPAVPVELKIKMPEHGLRIAWITDLQVQPETPIDHLTAAGNYIADKQPDVVICTGDAIDLESLNAHIEKGTLQREGKKYRCDLDAHYAAQEALVTPIAKVPGYSPVMVFEHGNHEDMITRYVQRHPEQDGFMSLRDLRLADYGWKHIYPFLQPVVIGGVAFCHYFPTGKMGHATTKAAKILSEQHMSACAGHQQGRDIAYSKRADGKYITAIIAGSFYQHDMHYLSPITNRHWRGMYFLHEVHDGQFDEMALGINYLVRRWGPEGIKAHKRS